MSDVPDPPDDPSDAPPGPPSVIEGPQPGQTDNPIPKRLYLDEDNRALLRQAKHELRVDADPGDVVRSALQNYLDSLRDDQ